MVSAQHFFSIFIKFTILLNWCFYQHNHQYVSNKFSKLNITQGRVLFYFCSEYLYVFFLSQLLELLVYLITEHFSHFFQLASKYGILCKYSFCLFFYFGDCISLCNPGSPGTHSVSVDQTGLEIQDLSTSASGGLILEAWVTMQLYHHLFHWLRRAGHEIHFLPT